MSQTTPNPAGFECAICNIILATPKEFVQHTQTAHQPHEPHCQCGVEIPCPGGTHPPGCLVLHMAKCPKHDSAPTITQQKPIISTDPQLIIKYSKLLPSISNATELHNTASKLIKEISSTADKVINKIVDDSTMPVINIINLMITYHIKKYPSKTEMEIRIQDLHRHIALPNSNKVDENNKIYQAVNYKKNGNTDMPDENAKDGLLTYLLLRVMETVIPAFELQGYTITYDTTNSEGPHYSIKW